MKKTLCGLVALSLISCAPAVIPKNILQYERQVIERRIYDDGAVEQKSSVHIYQRPKEKSL